MAFDQEKKFVGGWWMWVLALFVVTAIVVFGLRAVGLIGYTALEREVFEQSYQKQAGDTARRDMLKAQLAGVNAQLRRSDLSDAMRGNLEANKAALEVQLNAGN